MTIICIMLTRGIYSIFFKKTEIKTNIKMILVDEETGSWESEQYQQGIEHKK